MNRTKTVRSSSPQSKDDGDVGLRAIHCYGRMKLFYRSLRQPAFYASRKLGMIDLATHECAHTEDYL